MVYFCDIPLPLFVLDADAPGSLERDERPKAACGGLRARVGGREPAPLARFPLAWNHASDKKSRQLKVLERILVAQVCQLVRNAL